MSPICHLCHCHGGPDCCMKRLYPPLITNPYKTYIPPNYPYQSPVTAKVVPYYDWTSNKSEPLTGRVPATRPEEV